MKPLILASQSPRRAEILKQAGIDFIVRPSAVDEAPLPGEEPRSYVTRLARAKAQAVAAGPGEIVLGADTVVVIDDRILGKPSDTADAARMLHELSGREHEVITGVCLKRDNHMDCAATVTRVRFRAVAPDEIDAYVASGEPMDKAGAYAIQGLAEKFVARIDGSYTNVVGLPIEWINEHLRQLKSVQ